MKLVLPLTLLVALCATTCFAQKAPPWDVINTAQAGQTTVYMENTGGGFCGVPVELADYDNDGLIDYAVAPILANGGPSFARTDSGIVYVFKGNNSVGGIIDVGSLPAGQPLATIWGANSSDLLGTELFSADLNNDGISDLIIGASGYDRPGTNTVGAVYIIWGGPTLSGTIDLAASPAGVTTIIGQDLADRLGFWVEAGDINGDGIDDLLMSADDGNGISNSNTDRGEAHVIYGGQTFPATIDMAAPPVGLNYITVYGDDNGDQLGSCMHSADLDNDGYEELIVSAALNRAIGGQTGSGIAGGDGPGNSRSGCGDTYIIWGGPSLPSVINLATQTNSMLLAGTLTVVYGANNNDYLGEELASGDIDGDGFIDLLIGAITADGYQNQANNAGECVVLWGGPQLRGQTYDIANHPAGTSTLYGEQSGDIGADTLSMADVNGDGLADIYFSEPSGDAVRGGNTISGSGEVLIIYGSRRRFATEAQVGLLATDLEWPTRRVYGADTGDLQGYSMEGGDFDSDGCAEIFPNSMRGDGMNNANPDAGEVCIVSGRVFSKGIATLKDPPSIGTTVRFHAVGEPTHAFVGAFALSSTPAQTFPGLGTVYLANDLIFQASLMQLPPVFSNLTGTLDANGLGEYSLLLPPDPALVGIPVFTAYVTIDSGSGLVETVGHTTSFVISN